MKQRIYRSLCLIALLSLFLSTFASLALYMSFHNSDNQEDLQSHCTDLAIAAAEVEQLGGDPLQFLQKAADPSVRITVIHPDGTVLWDSQVSADTMDNHSKRPEIIQTLKNGSGQANRRSETVGQDSYYCARSFGDQDLILRLGRNSRNILGSFLQILPLDMLSCVLLFAACLRLADRETDRIVKPMLKAADRLNGLHPEEFYEELRPFLNTIRSQNDTILSQMESIRQDKDTLTLILKNMKEGLVTLSSDKRILSVNDSAMAMLGSFLRHPEGENLLMLTRNPSLITAVEQALDGQNCSGTLPMENQRICQYFVNPVYSGSDSRQVSGVILFLLDVTEQELAQKSREEFSANVSHELKTPLTSISGFAELMESGMASSAEDVRMFSGLIRKEASRLLKLIDDIIHLSRITNDSDKLQDAVELLALAEEECQRLLPEAAKKEISIRCQGAPAVLSGNRTMLSEVVYNLCENAVKYNQKGGSVTVSVQPMGHQVLLSVSDTGIGIPKEHQGRIFERFYRVDKSRSKETGGTGLGLSIVKHIVQIHNGQLSIDSEPGKGTTITAVFPVLSQSISS